MTMLLLFFALSAFVLLVGAATISPNVSVLSKFELERRKVKMDGSIQLDDLRERLYQDIVSVQRVLVAVFLIVCALLLVAAFGAFFGVLIGIPVALEYGAIARISFVHSKVQKLYDRYELQILQFLERYQSITRWVRSVVPEDRVPRLASKDELAELVKNSKEILSDSEKQQVVTGLEFEEKIVGDLMTPKSVVNTVQGKEILGPLVLDDLHKTGHNRFPVIDGDIDKVIGVLYLRDALVIDSSSKKTPRVDAVMNKKVYYIRENHTLAQALSGFLRTHHHMFIVINEFHETVGIITLEDTLEALLGRSIIDEFDAHDDMRAVAKRQAARLHSKSTSAVKP